MPRPSVWLGALYGLIAGTGLATAQSPALPAPPDLPVTVVVPPPSQSVPGAEPPSEPVPVAEKPPRPADAGLGGSLRSSDEYLLWWMKSAPLPPLATRNPTGAAPVLSDPNTRILIGDKADLGE